MPESREGQRVPEVTFRIRQNNQWVNLTTEDIFKGKNVVLFALPGAFTPTCSSAHLPRYNELAPVFKSNGIDSIVCVAVNDGFVMEAWGADLNADNIFLLADGNGEFAEQMGMLVDKRELGFGKRSCRYSMLVRDGVIEKQFIEPGAGLEVSDADTMLKYINASARVPKRISIFTKPNCPHCARAKERLQEAGYSYEEISLGGRGVTYSTLAAVTGRGTTPQVYVEGEHIGSADELEQWLAQQAQ